MFDNRELLVPVNRRLLIKVEDLNPAETKSGVLLPDDFNKESDTYIRAKIVAAAPDCNGAYVNHLDKDVVVEKSMIEEFTVGANSVKMILENYVLALVKTG